MSGDDAFFLGEMDEKNLFDLKREAQVKVDRDAQVNKSAYLRKVKVVGYDPLTGQTSIIFGSDTTRQVDGIRSLASYLPTVNDEVMALAQGTMLVLLGPVADEDTGLFHGKVRKTNSQTFTTNVEAAISFNAEDLDTTTDMWDVGTPTRLICRRPGWYQCMGGDTWAANATGERMLSLVYVQFGTGTQVVVARQIGPPSPTGGNSTSQAVAGEYLFGDQDALELRARQVSGGNLDVVGTADSRTFMSLRYLHP